MNTLFHYALQSAICLTVLYVPWMLMLRKETFFRLNRIALLCMMLLSMALPLIDITIPVNETELNEMVDEDTAVQMASYMEGTAMPLTSSIPLLPPLYIIGIVLMVGYRMTGLWHVRQSMRQGCLWVQREHDTTVYCHTGNSPSYSWLSHIVISETDYEQHPEVLAHELSHVRHLHSYDNLLVMLCQCLQWFNPFVYLLGDSLRDVHEYEADADVLESGTDATRYQLLLIGKAVRGKKLAMVNGFVCKSLKQRIQMMLRIPSSPWQRSKFAVLLPAIMLTLLLVANYDIRREVMSLPLTKVLKETSLVKPAEESVNNPQSSLSVKQQVKKEQHQQIPVEVEEEKTAERIAPTAVVPTQMAQFPGGNAALRDYLAQHLPKTEEAGRLFVSFVVGEDGSLSDIRILRSGSAEANEAALRLVADMPRWIPGRRNGQIVASPYTLPIDY
ncbi:MAG: energy transducer TonB [Prevotella sp.]|nr:energy transducer TonB [Prevotella sp.]